MIWGSAVLAASQTDVPPAYVVAAEDNGIPPEVLYAVASAESVVNLHAGRRPWPWTLNVAGQGMRFGDRRSACAALRDALEQTRIVDVGIAQLNVRWQTHLFGPGKRFADPCDALDPYANLDEAARLIRGHFENTRDWLAAAGRYHRPAGGAPATRYRGVVQRELARLSTTPSSDGMLASLNSAPKSAPSPRFPAEASAIATVHLDQPPSDHELTWVTPEQRSEDDDVAWVDPTPRRWTAEVASR